MLKTLIIGSVRWVASDQHQIDWLCTATLIIFFRNLNTHVCMQQNITGEERRDREREKHFPEWDYSKKQEGNINEKTKQEQKQA